MQFSPERVDSRIAAKRTAPSQLILLLDVKQKRFFCRHSAWLSLFFVQGSNILKLFILWVFFVPDNLLYGLIIPSVTKWFVLIFSLFDADWLHFSVFITRVIFVPLLIMYVHKALLWREKNIGIALAHLHADKCLLSACRCADAIPMFNLFKAMLCGQTLKLLQKKSALPTLSSSNLP